MIINYSGNSFNFFLLTDLKMSIKIFYPCFKSKSMLPEVYINIKNEPYKTLTKRVISDHYECVYVEIWKNPPNLDDLEKTGEFLDNILIEFTSDKNPLGAPFQQFNIMKIGTHTRMETGDVVQLNDRYYVVSDGFFYELQA